MNQKHKGFTLIEIVIAVVILGIIAAIAIPSYQSMLRKSNRTEAKTSLNLIANEQARFFATNRAYTGDMTNFSLKDPTVASATSPNAHYTITVAAGASGAIESSYIITAVPKSALQLGDDECKTYTLSSAGVKTALNDGGTASEGCWK